jgi:Putative beta-barrel porin 2
LHRDAGLIAQVPTLVDATKFLPRWGDRSVSSRFKKLARNAASAIVGALILCLAVSPVGAQGFDPLDGANPGSLPGSIAALGPTNPLEAPSREYTGVPVGGWLIYASALAGGVYDDNLFQTPDNKTATWGVRLLPSIEAIRNNGIHRTKLYGFIDGRFYSEEEQGEVFNSVAGLEHAWEVQRDFVVRFKGDASRTTDTSNGGTVATPTGFETVAAPLTYNELAVAGSLFKSFDRIYVSLDGAAGRTIFEDIKDSIGNVIPQGYRDEDAYVLKGRLGVFLTPVIYGFVEPSQNWRRFADGSFDSNGQRIVGGFGTDRISLFRGEVFAGYQRQDYDNAAFGTVSNFAYGGKLSWYPLRELTVRLEVDRNISDSTLFTPGNPNGSPTENTGVVLRTDYRLTDIWSLSTRLGYDFIDYTRTPREDNQWLAGLTASYFVWRDLALTFDYEYIELDSNFAANSFTRNIYTFGGTYKF